MQLPGQALVLALALATAGQGYCTYVSADLLHKATKVVPHEVCHGPTTIVKLRRLGHNILSQDTQS